MNGRGEQVGIVFDGNYEGLGNDFFITTRKVELFRLIFGTFYSSSISSAAPAIFSRSWTFEMHPQRCDVPLNLQSGTIITRRSP